MQQINMRFRIPLLISLLFIGACSGKSYYYYSINDYPEVVPATVNPWYKDTYYFDSEALDVFPIFIDGKITESYSRDNLPSYFILPGEHTIKVALFTEDRVRIVTPEPITFKAKSGQTYLTKASVEKNITHRGEEMEVKISIWIEDENTKEIVGYIDFVK